MAANAFSRAMTTRRKRFIPLYVVVIVLIAASFGWQMLHGICPVP